MVRCACGAQLTWLLDDPGIPADWRHLEGHSVNTYLFINAQGKERYFKMRWLPEGGARLASLCCSLHVS